LIYTTGESCFQHQLLLREAGVATIDSCFRWGSSAFFKRVPRNKPGYVWPLQAAIPSFLSLRSKPLQSDLEPRFLMPLLWAARRACRPRRASPGQKSRGTLDRSSASEAFPDSCLLLRGYASAAKGAGSGGYPFPLAALCVLLWQEVSPVFRHRL
jgi:hypothetical protein